MLMRIEVVARPMAYREKRNTVKMIDLSCEQSQWTAESKKSSRKRENRKLSAVIVSWV